MTSVISLRLIKVMNVGFIFFPHLVNTCNDTVDCTESETCDCSCLGSASHTFSVETFYKSLVFLLT